MIRRILKHSLWLVLLCAAPLHAQAAAPMTPIDSAQAITFRGWSYDGQWFAYFTHQAWDFYQERSRISGTLHFYNVETQASCIAADASFDKLYEDGEANLHNAWLRDGHFINLSAEITLFTPCTTNPRQTITHLFPEPIVSVDPSPTAPYCCAANAIYGCIPSRRIPYKKWQASISLKIMRCM